MTVNECIKLLQKHADNGCGDFVVRVITETTECQVEQEACDIAVSKRQQAVILLPENF